MQMKRRSAERVYFENEPVGLGPSRGGVLTRGRVHDISESGILIEVPEVLDIGHGVTIRTLLRDADTPKHARVIRVEHGEREGIRETRLACRWITRGDRLDRTRAHPRTSRIRTALENREERSS